MSENIDPIFGVEHENIIPLDFAQEPRPAIRHDDHAFAIRIITEWRKILSARALALLALVGGVAIWGYVVSEPSTLRLWAATLYSGGIFLPCMWLHLRKG